MRTYLEDELQRIELTIFTSKCVHPGGRRRAGQSPVKGMVRFAVTGWEPLGNGTTNFLVVYNGTAWVAV